MTDRDTFASAALTGMMARTHGKAEELAAAAYRVADAMLRFGAVSGCETVPDQDSRTWETYPSKQTAPPCVETDGLSSGSRSGQINRSPERQSPDRERGESSLRDDTHPDTKGRATGGPEHNTPLDVEELLGELHHIAGSEDHVEYDIRRTACDAEHAIDRLRAWVNELQLSKVEIDALQHVVEDGRLFDLSDYGYLRSLLVRLRPEWEDESDRSEPIKSPGSYSENDEKRVVSDTNRDARLAALGRLSEFEQELERTHGVRPTQAECTKQDEGSVPVSRNRNEPVAWAVISHSGAYYSSFGDRAGAEDWRAELMAAEGREYFVVPLFRDLPALTDAEREAVEWALKESVWSYNPDCGEHPATLRGLLERLK